MAGQGLRKPIPRIFTLLLLVTVLLTGCTTTVQPPKPSPTPFLRSGDEARLILGDVETFFIAIDKDVYDEFRKAANVKDTLGMLELVQDDKLFMVDSNTKVLLLERGTTFWTTTSWRVRVLEGSSRGRAGWLHKSYISP